MASPTCLVKDGAGAYTATTNGNNVTPANTISIQLASVAGVSAWSISCVYTDELSSAATVTAALVIDSLNKIATYTAPTAGRAYIFQSKINGGIDVNGTVQPALTTTLGIYTLAGSGNRVLATNETIEGNPTFGYVATINPALRSVAGGGTVPSGSGIPHIVGGAYSAAATLIVDADVSAAAAVAVSKLAPGANTQVLTTTAGVTVWAAAAGGGTTPTGTGFTHITAGAQDVASKKVDLTAAADVIVPATAGGVVTSSGTALQQASNVLAGTNFVSVGAAPALNGAYRLSNAGKVTWRNQGGTADYCGAMVDTSNNLYIGSNDADAEKVSVVILNGASGAYLKAAGAYQIVLDGTNINAYVPIVGGGTSPYGVHGKVTDATAGTFTLTAASYKYDAIQLTGATAGTVTFPASTDATAYSKTIINTSGVVKTLSNGGATTLIFNTGNIARVLFDTAGVHLAAASTAWV